MSLNNTEIHSQGGKWTYEFEFTLTAGGAIVANADGSTTTDPLVTATKTGTGTYRIDITGNFFKVIKKDCSMHASAAGSQQAQITAVGLGTGTAGPTGEAVTTLTIITGNSNAVPAAADQASGTVSARVTFQKNKL